MPEKSFPPEIPSYERQRYQVIRQQVVLLSQFALEHGQDRDDAEDCSVRDIIWTDENYTYLLIRQNNDSGVYYTLMTRAIDGPDYTYLYNEVDATISRMIGDEPVSHLANQTPLFEQVFAHLQTFANQHTANTKATHEQLIETTRTDEAFQGLTRQYAVDVVFEEYYTDWLEELAKTKDQAKPDAWSRIRIERTVDTIVANNPLLDKSLARWAIDAVLSRLQAANY